MSSNRNDPYNQAAKPDPDPRDEPIPWDPNIRRVPGLTVREISNDEWQAALLEHEARKLAKNVGNS